MNIKDINKYFVYASLLLSLISCQDAIESLPLEYWEDPRFASPKIEESWNLELLETHERVYVYQDKLYDNLFTRNLGWNGGSGVKTTLLPDGNVFWSFNDSFYGKVESNTRARDINNNVPRNSVMIQTLSDDKVPGINDNNIVWGNTFVQTSDPDNENYYNAKTFIRHPLAELSDEDINEGKIDQEYIYWAADATVFDGKLQMLWSGKDKTNKLLNKALVIYDLSGNPNSENYLAPIYINHDFLEDDPYNFGSSMWEDEDGHTYLYGTNGYDVLCARTQTHDLKSKWEYYVGNADGVYSWQDNYPTAEDALLSKISENGNNLPWVFNDGDYYYMTGQGNANSKDVYIYIEVKHLSDHLKSNNVFLLYLTI